MGRRHPLRRRLPQDCQDKRTMTKQQQPMRFPLLLRRWWQRRLLKLMLQARQRLQSLLCQLLRLMQLLLASRVVVSVIALPLKLRPRLWCRIEVALQQMAGEDVHAQKPMLRRAASSRAPSIVKCMMHDDLEFTGTCLYRQNASFSVFYSGHDHMAILKSLLLLSCQRTSNAKTTCTLG